MTTEIEISKCQTCGGTGIVTRVVWRVGPRSFWCTTCGGNGQSLKTCTELPQVVSEDDLTAVIGRPT